jgi:hypothetical protein
MSEKKISSESEMTGIKCLGEKIRREDYENRMNAKIFW